jgi:hypothetical protein
MDARDRQRATWLSVGRIVFGASFMVAPGLLGVWIGEDARRPRVKAMARAFGARDLALGVGAYLALSDPDAKGGDVRRWLQLGAMCDTVDATATLIAARRLPKAGVAVALAAALAGATTGFSLAAKA